MEWRKHLNYSSKLTTVHAVGDKGVLCRRVKACNGDAVNLDDVRHLVCSACLNEYRKKGGKP